MYLRCISLSMRKRLTLDAPRIQEETMEALRAAPAAWCAAEVCRLDVSQDGNSILVASPDGGSRLSHRRHSHDTQDFLHSSLLMWYSLIVN